MSNYETNTKNLPFKTEQLLKAVDESAKRSRTILLMLTFTSFLITMALVNSLVPKFNWFKSKIEINKDIIVYIILPNEYVDSSRNEKLKFVNKLSDYVMLKEKRFNNNEIDTILINYANSLDKKYHLSKNFKLQNPDIAPVLFEDIAKRKEKYEEIGSSLKYLYEHNLFDKESLLLQISKLDDAYVEHLDLIRVPILGISFHVNYLGVYSGFLLTILLVLFYFSLLREKINLKITFKRGWIDLKHHHYYLYEYASMLQVLSIPKKLFSYETKKNLTFILFTKIAIYFPLIIYSAIFFYDLSTIDIGSETNFGMTNVTIGLSFCFFLLIIIYSRKIEKQWKQIDILWDNQSYEFNLEYIMEAIGEDKDINLINLFPPKISEKDLNDVKFLWYSILVKAFKKNKTISKDESIKILSNFISRTFKKDFEIDNNEIPQKSIENMWMPLKAWFNSKGKKNVDTNFRNTLCEAINELKKNHCEKK